MNTRQLFVIMLLVLGTSQATQMTTPRSDAWMTCDAAKEVLLLPSRLPTTDEPIARPAITIVRFSKSKPAQTTSERFELRYTGGGMGKEGWDVFKPGSTKQIGQILLKSNQAYDDGLSSSLALRLPSGDYSDCRWFAGQMLALTTQKRTIYIIAKNPKTDVRETKSWRELEFSYQSFDYSAAPTDKPSLSLSGGKFSQLQNGTKRFLFMNAGYFYQIDLLLNGSSSISVSGTTKLLGKETAIAQSFVMPQNLR